MEKDESPFFITEENAPKIESYQELISHKLNNISTQVDSCIERAEYENALISLNKLVVLDSENYSNYFRRAHCLFHLCDFKSAIINIEKAYRMQNSEELNEKCGFYHFMYAQTLYDQKLYMEAVRQFDKSNLQKSQQVPLSHSETSVCYGPWPIHTLAYGCDKGALLGLL